MDRAARVGMIRVTDREPEPPGDETAAAKPPAKPLGQHPEQRVQHAEIVGVGGEDVRGAELPAPPKTAQSALSGIAATSPIRSS